MTQQKAQKEQRFVVLVVFTAARIPNVQRKKKRVLRKGEVSPLNTIKKKAGGGGGADGAKSSLGPKKKREKNSNLCLSLSGRVETMKRTFGERRARARGEVSHDPFLSSFFICVCVCALAS